MMKGDEGLDYFIDLIMLGLPDMALALGPASANIHHPSNA